MRLIFLLFLLSNILGTELLMAQTNKHPWSIGIGYNVSNMEGLLNQKYFTARNYSGGLKLAVSRYLSPSFNIRLDGAYGSIFYPKVTFYPLREKGVFNQMNFFESSFLFEYKLNNNYIFKENAWVQPYLFIGIGTNNMNKDWNTYFPWGGGLKIKCTSWLAVNLETTYKVNIDNSYSYLQHCAGLVFSMGKAVKSKNTDGVVQTQKVKKDLKDLNTKVSIDTDKDGISDSEDECPFIAGPNNLKGCPDADGDGIADVKDDCPNEKGIVANKGCPEKILDSDLDGVLDNEDKCPSEKGSKLNNGCPLVEKMIEEKIVDLNSQDIKNNNIVSVLPTSLELFYPLSGSQLNDEQKKSLDNLILQLNSNTYSVIKVNGYTSNTGNDNINIKLSMDRAITVINYLSSKGIDMNKMRAYGFGPYNAKYTNATPEESVKNQRVVIEIIP